MVAICSSPKRLIFISLLPLQESPRPVAIGAKEKAKEKRENKNKNKALKRARW
jgi:hypothetical protein